MTAPHLLARRLLDQAVREDFLCFLRKAVGTLSEGDQLEANWHLEAIAYRLGIMEQNGGARLIVNVPPRSLKSVTISVAWVAFMLGRNPRLKFICVSYAHELALKHARDCRTLMQSDWYGRAFPGTVLTRCAEHDLATTVGGGRYSTSVGGTLTGLGGDIIVIDDPIKPDEAQSETARTNAWEWFGGVLSSRLDSKARGSIVIVMQRVHEDDLTGRLLEGGGWDLLSLPALALGDEEIPIGPGRVHRRRAGDLLHPERESRVELDRLRAAMGSLSFEAQYQQSPIPADGNIVKAKWFGRYSAPPEPQPSDLIIQSWDCASKVGLSNDWSVCITALERHGRLYILDVYRARLEFPGLRQQAIALARSHAAKALLIEDAGSGQQLLQTLKADAPPGVPRPIGSKPVGEKIVRMNRPSADIEAGKVLLPEEAPWLASFMAEVLGFPNARHDDQVDALSQLLNWSGSRREYTPPVGPTVFYEDEHGAWRAEGALADLFNDDWDD